MAVSYAHIQLISYTDIVDIFEAATFLSSSRTFLKIIWYFNQVVKMILRDICQNICRLKGNILRSSILEFSFVFLLMFYVYFQHPTLLFQRYCTTAKLGIAYQVKVSLTTFLNLLILISLKVFVLKIFIYRFEELYQFLIEAVINCAIFDCKNLNKRQTF